MLFKINVCPLTTLTSFIDLNIIAYECLTSKKEKFVDNTQLITKAIRELHNTVPTIIYIER